MIISLYTFTWITAAGFLLLGFPLLLVPTLLESPLRGMLRNMALGTLTMLLGGGWFLFKITQLGQADFGDYKAILFALFAVTLLGSLFFVRDFLAVRGIAVLVLLSANVGLKSAYALYDTPSRLTLVTVLYVLIVLAIWLGIAPYFARDWLNALFAKVVRARILGGIFVGVSAALALSAMFY